MFNVTRYGQRNFAVYGQADTPGQEPELVAVTVYRKGARRVAELLNQALTVADAARKAVKHHTQEEITT